MKARSVSKPRKQIRIVAKDGCVLYQPIIRRVTLFGVSGLALHKALEEDEWLGKFVVTCVHTGLAAGRGDSKTAAILDATRRLSNAAKRSNLTAAEVVERARARAEDKRLHSQQKEAAQ